MERNSEREVGIETGNGSRRRETGDGETSDQSDVSRRGGEAEALVGLSC